MISVRNMSAGYGRLQVLRDVSIEVAAGELVAILGANGAGKSTLLRTIQGFLPPSAGQIRLDGQDAFGKTADQMVRMGLTMVPESRALFSSMTVLDNLLLGAYVHRGKSGADDSRAATLKTVYELFPALEERSAALAGTLSGGQQQMLAIGRALMTQPRALMLDEPSLGLAPLLVRDIFAGLGTLRRQGLAILVVEQNARSILRIAQRAYVLERGKVVREGAAGELLEDSSVVEAYLGTSQTAKSQGSPEVSVGESV